MGGLRGNLRGLQRGLATFKGGFRGDLKVTLNRALKLDAEVTLTEGLRGTLRR